jgi:predicted nucleotide-binding protein (sugar kinase/HSP70/actin superfamily)
MIRVVQRPDFDPSRAAFFMPGGSGPCRFGQYHCLHKLILNDLGVGQVPIVAPSADRTLYDDWRYFEKGTLNLAWTGLCVFDVLQKARLATRPYELHPGSIDAVYQSWARRFCELLETRPSEATLVKALAKAAAEFAAAPTLRHPARPRIGVVGEIYIRHHEFANNHLLRQLEGLGAETNLSGFPEWQYYENWLRRQGAWRERRWQPWMVSVFHNQIQQRRERRLNTALESLLGHFAEPPTEKLLRLAEPYLHPSLEGGEAVLSVGKMIDLAHQGCHGVINVMPFACMPSTIVDGVMKRQVAALGSMPVLSISYDGQQDPMLQTRLEAFLYQARAYQEKQNRQPSVTGDELVMGIRGENVARGLDGSYATGNRFT